MRIRGTGTPRERLGALGAIAALGTLCIGVGVTMAVTTITDPQGDATQNSAIPGSLDIKSATQTRVGTAPRRISHIVAMYGNVTYPLGAGGNGDTEVCVDLYEHKPTGAAPNPRPYHEICARGSNGASRKVPIYLFKQGGIQVEGRASERLKPKTVRFTFRRGAIGSPGHYFWRWNTSDEIDGPVDAAPDSPGTVRLGFGG
jgi:hypothetical protein